MDFQFEFPNGYELYDLYLMNKLYARKKPSRRLGVALVRVLMGIVGLLVVAVSGLGLLNRPFLIPVSGTMGVFLLIYGILMLALALGYYFFGARRSRQIILNTVGATSIALGEHGFAEKTPVSESTVEYSAVKEIYFWKNCWFLFLDERHAEILALRCMKSGDAAAIPAFLREKTGKEIRYVSKKEKTN